MTKAILFFFLGISFLFIFNAVTGYFLYIDFIKAEDLSAVFIDILVYLLELRTQDCRMLSHMLIDTQHILKIAHMPKLDGCRGHLSIWEGPERLQYPYCAFLPNGKSKIIVTAGKISVSYLLPQRVTWLSISK